MVALHPVSLEPTPLDPSLPDDDLMIALPADAALDRTGADALVQFATESRADAWYGDISVGDRTHYRTAWSPTRLLVDPLAAAPLAVRVGWLRARGVAPADPDVAFRLAREGADVVHVTTVLTRHETPPPFDVAVVNAHLAALGTAATLRDGRLEPDPGFAPAVSIIIPTAGTALPDGAVAVHRLIERLGPVPDRFELVFVIGDEFVGDARSLEGPGHTVVRRPPGSFNFSTAVNLGVLRSRADHVLLLNDDTEPRGFAFIDRLAGHLSDPTVAAVGALLTYPDGTVQHAGLVLDDARPLHPFVGWDPPAIGPYGGLMARDVVAVTGGCMMLRRSDFLAAGGLSSSFPLSFNDVDLCVRLRRAGRRVVMEPAATLVHHETLSRTPTIAADEWDRWIDRWGEIVDPWYHPAYERPDDPHALSRNADHRPPAAEVRPPPIEARRPRLRSRLHRGRLADERS